ncbi:MULTISPECIES: DUF4350 domain-containing protein [unclassified Saccharicrinis]|uniref:DUF4350 domain-containing protein n=1 Tax=unclassified Saccharicrinis TaxID=2646859 RepID=UPI003D3362E9
MGKGIHNKYLVFGVTAAFMLYLMVLIISPGQIDWSLSFSKDDKIPFGNSILFDELEQLFAKEDIKTAHTPIYNFLKDRRLEGAGIIYINDSFEPDKFDLGKMLNVVESGNNIFIAAVEFSEQVKDTLGFKMDEDFSFRLMQQDSIQLNLVNPKLKSPWGYHYKRAYHRAYFQSYDTLKTTVLGLGEKAKTNFIKIKYGAGNFFINTNPLAFTNYNLLIGENYEYVFKCLSYLPGAEVIWDEFYKQDAPISGSEFRYILSQKALRYAWYIMFFGILIYMVFAAKRQQRMIPIINAPENTTLTFIETIGRLYFRKRDHLDIAKKKYTYFLEFLRTKYYIDTANINSELYDAIAEKCEVPIRTVKQLFDIAVKLQQVKSISEEDLEQFNKKIEFFYDKCRTTKK